MTFKQKYKELFNKYEEKTGILREATELIEFRDGFDNKDNLPYYFKSHREQKFAERDFQELLNYITTGGVNPDSEYVHAQYMYDIIKQDQERKGVVWDDIFRIPDGSIKGYSCQVGLINDGEINRLEQGTEYKFPVISLEHGRECYIFLAEKLHGDIDKEEIMKLEFNKKLDPKRQIYVKIKIIIWPEH